MSFSFGERSLKVLSTVRQPMQELAKAAIALSKIDFSVVQGARTQDEQFQLYGKGRTPSQMKDMGLPPAYAKQQEKIVTWTTHSNHIGGNAIDVCPFVDGVLNWDDDGELGLWPQIATAFKEASKQTGIPVYWGGDWSQRKKDRPHFSLIPG